MVYGNFFRKPFSKTRVRLPLESWLSLCSLSFSLCSLLFTVSSHWATLSHPQHPEPPRFLSRPARSQPTPSHLTFSLTDLSARTKATIAPSHRSHSKGLPSIRRTDLYLMDLILIWSLFFFFFSFDIWDWLIFFGKHNDIWEFFI